MFNKSQFLITLVVLFSVNFANAQAWVPSDTVPNTHANQPITGNPQYHNVNFSAPSGNIPASVQAAMRAAQETARQQEAAAKKKHCENKAKALTDAEAQYDQCSADVAQQASNRLAACSKTQSITISVPELRYQPSINLNATAARILGIEIGAITSISVSGSVTYNPENSCRIRIEDQREADNLQCRANRSKISAMFSICP